MNIILYNSSISSISCALTRASQLLHLIEHTHPSSKIAGATIESNTCSRHMTYNVNDLAYIQDIKALDDKITALAEQSHQNDIETFSMRDEFATVEEVNTVLTENYLL